MISTLASFLLAAAARAGAKLPAVYAGRMVPQRMVLGRGVQGVTPILGGDTVTEPAF